MGSLVGIKDCNDLQAACRAQDQPSTYLSEEDESSPSQAQRH